MNGIVCSWRIIRWISLVKGRRIMHMRWMRVGYEVLRMDLMCRLNGRYNSILSLKIANHLIKKIWIHRCEMKNDERFDDGWNMNLELGAILDFVSIWFEMDWIWYWFELIWFDIDLIWFDIDWIWVWFDLIKTLWHCKKVNGGFEWKSNVGDNAPMSKVEDVMQSWIKRRREWN